MPDRGEYGGASTFIAEYAPDKKRGYFFAALYDSRLLFMTLEGEMGVLISVGADANFVLSVGGCHPRYLPPPLPFPSPKRISFDIVNTSAARIRVVLAVVRSRVADQPSL